MLRRIFQKHEEETSIPVYLVAGLGNPGREYRENRHNIGFMLVDRLCRELLITPGKVQSKAIIATGQYAGKKLILAKPQTYMNLSGQSIGGLMRFYKIPHERLLVAHDDLDLPLGTHPAASRRRFFGAERDGFDHSAVGHAEFCPPAPGDWPPARADGSGGVRAAGLSPGRRKMNWKPFSIGQSRLRWFSSNPVWKRR